MDVSVWMVMSVLHRSPSDDANLRAWLVSSAALTRGPKPSLLQGFTVGAHRPVRLTGSSRHMLPSVEGLPGGLL